MRSPWTKRCFFHLFWVAVLILFQAAELYGAEDLSGGRRLWDTVMMVVNFGILVLLFIKYGRKPLMAYLNGVRDEIGTDLDTVRSRYESAKSAWDEEAAKLDHMEQRLQEIEQAILELGRREKEQIIQEGKLLAEKMIRDAGTYSQRKMAAARKTARDELVDLAVSIAEERLMEEMSTKDNDRFIEEFVSGLRHLKKADTRSGNEAE